MAEIDISARLGAASWQMVLSQEQNWFISQLRLEAFTFRMRLTTNTGSFGFFIKNRGALALEPFFLSRLGANSRSALGLFSGSKTAAGTPEG
jgi:hypothetical protein